MFQKKEYDEGETWYQMEAESICRSTLVGQLCIQVEGEKWKVEQSGHGMFLCKIHLLDEVADSVSERSPMPTKTFFLISQSTTDLVTLLDRKSVV